MPKDLEKRGLQISLNRVTPNGLQATLDNGVVVDISFNKTEIHIHFAGTDKGVKIRELEETGNKANLSNYVTIQYEPRPNN